MIGLTSLITEFRLCRRSSIAAAPVFVLGKIDEILAWEQRKETERDTKFVELGRYLCEVRAGQYWRLESLKCFDEFLERRFPESRRKAYYLMSIHEHLPPQARKQLKEVGWAKGLELAKLARRDGQHFDCATWLHKARQMPQEDFKQEVEKELTGRETEPWEIIYFKLYQSQMPVIEKAIETAALMLGSDRSRGYCLEMICADFLAGANLDNGDPETLLFSMTRFFKFLPGEQQQAVPRSFKREGLMSSIGPKSTRLRLDPKSVRESANSRCCVAMAGDVNRAAQCRTWKCTTGNFAVTQAPTSRKTLSRFASLATPAHIARETRRRDQHRFCAKSAAYLFVCSSAT